MNNIRPLRVLHIIDSLGGGGSERLVWDIVRLSDQTRVKHRVVTNFSDGTLGPYVYAEPLRQLGAYGRPQHKRGNPSAQSRDTAFLTNCEDRSPAGSYGKDFSKPRVRSILGWMRRLPPGLKNPMARVWNLAFSIWQQGKRAVSHFRSLLSIPAEYFRFRPDIIHTHGFYTFKYGLLFKKLFGRPIVHMVPCLFSQMEAQGTGWLASRYRRFHHLIDRFALDPGYRSELLGVGVPAEKLIEISGTLDLQAIARVNAQRERHRAEIRTRLRIPVDAIIALSVGRMDPSKGHAYALEALPAMLKGFPNLHWVLLGDGSDRHELETRIKELGVEHHAHLMGFDPEPLPYYAAADVYLRTTTMEGENISSRQAIAMGLATVGFDSCPETDLIAKLGHGVVVPNADATALAAATCRILSLPDQGRAMGSLGVDYCNGTLGIQKNLDNLLSVYSYLHGKRVQENRGMGGEASEA